jgi:hypothetical protein
MGDTKSAWPRAPSSAVRALLSAVQIAALILRLLAAAVKSAASGVLMAVAARQAVSVARPRMSEAVA